MNKLGFHITYISIIVVLLLSLVASFSKPKKEIEVIKIQRDTTILTILDTIRETRFVEVSKGIIDTLFVYVNDTLFLPLPRETKVYEGNLFKAQVSGYQPSLDWMDIYQETKYITTKETIEKEMVRKQWEMYFGLGIWASKDFVAPTLGLTLYSPHNCLLSANLGYFDNKVIYGGTIQLKFTNQK